MTTKETKEKTDHIDGLERSHEALSKLVADLTPASLAAPTPAPTGTRAPC